MKLTTQQIKRRYFDRIYAEAPMVLCGCGCGCLIKSKDHYGRDRKYKNGHNNRIYDDPSQHKREWNHRNRSQRAKYKSQFVHAFKKELIVNAGAECSLCGLPFDGECTALFDFHHRDPDEKLFNVNNASLNKYSKGKIRKEAGKCDLLCANCHRLLHWDWEELDEAPGAYKDIEAVMEQQKDLVDILVRLEPLGVVKG
jgi:hypothetical protein